MTATPSDRVLVARLAAHERWANTTDRTAATSPGRAAFAATFERRVDPDSTMEPAERARRIESARKAYYARLALKSAQARRARAEADRLAAEVEQALAATEGGGA